MSVEGRKPRADSQRNRERLMAAAKAAFAEAGPEVSLDEIARRAGVGIGTLYRHFPTRDAVMQAVYQREVEQLAEAADRLAETQRPGEALRQWMRLFVDYIATKKVIAPALAATVGGPSQAFAAAGGRIIETMNRLVRAAAASGDIRADTDPADVLRALVGFTYASSAPGWEASAKRLVEILMDGLAAAQP